ncbi:MAG: IS66 family insertion sequence element accessory protein TnpA [Trichloromonadaceae bacterium]
MPDLKQEWTDKIAAWHASGQSIAAWCRQHDESYCRFIYWRKRLELKPKTTGRFVELTFGTSSLALECNGMTLHIERGFDRDLLRDVLSLLRAV